MTTPDKPSEIRLEYVKCERAIAVGVATLEPPAGEAYNLVCIDHCYFSDGGVHSAGRRRTD